MFCLLILLVMSAGEGMYLSAMVTNAAMKSGRRGMFNFLLFNSFGYILRVSFSLPYKNPAGTSTNKVFD